MNIEKQKLECEITEMLEVIEKAREIYANDITDHTENEYICEGLLDAGYRKQSENMVEVVRCKECRNCEKVPSILGTVLYCNEWCKDVTEDTFCSFGAKMKGGAE
jgi:hypothetical protein